MPADLSDHFQELMDMELFMSILVVFAAFLVPTIVRNVVEPRSPWDLPDEVYGVGVAFAGTYSDEYQMEVVIGGGLYSVDKFARRFDLKQRVTQMSNAIL